MNEQNSRAQRMLIVSNRLPFTAVEQNDELTFQPSAGGLVSGLASWLQTLRLPARALAPEGETEGPPWLPQASTPTEYVWVGWPGGAVSDPEKQRVLTERARDFHSLPVFISEDEMEKFYYGFCNSTIWPLFHYFPTFTHYDPEFWDEYRRVNERYADALVEVMRPDDVIWVHDYQLMLLPAMLRKRMPSVSIGFFLHIPFPGFELFRLLPRRWGREILQGMLGADLIGFHTHDYTQYFLRSVMRILGHDHNMGQIIAGDRIVKADTFPMGIDFDKYHNAVTLPEVQEYVDRMRGTFGDTKIVLSIDRLDYTKGIAARLKGYEAFLEQFPKWRKKVVLALVVVPSRIGVGRYRDTKENIEEMVGRINGKYGSLDWVPIRYQYTFVPHDQLIALYHVADVGLVTPLRDGMNLIAKEFIAASTETGVLVLSEMAGAAHEMGEAIVINPNSTEEIAEALDQALTMPAAEQKRRNVTMQKRMRRYNVVSWADDFVRELNRTCETRDMLKRRLLSPSARAELLKAYRQAKRRLLLIDYDGTLMPFSPDPLAVPPNARVLDILNRLSADEHNCVVVISGRDRNTLDEWLGDLPVGLVAEHGVWIRENGGEWLMHQQLSNDWKPRIRPVLEMYSDRLPGSFIEEKEYSIVWHYRAADAELGTLRSQELLDYLVNFTANIDVQVLQGNKVVEVKTGGVNKGTSGLNWLQKVRPDFVLAVGDDWTDEYLFMALPGDAYSLRVGLTHSHARHNLSDPAAVLDLLAGLAEAASPTGLRA